MAALARTGTQMFSEVSDSVSQAIRDLTIDSALPEDFGELAFEVAIKSVSNGIGRSPDLEGSGTQSFILLHFLNLIDRVSRQRAFGWVQASIWAMEEPESFLHSGLRAKFAADLDAYAKESRRQVFVTTHQDEFVRVSDSAWLAFQDRNGTQIERAPSREILEKSARLAITTYRHPLLEYPDVPIVIVEGKYDHVYLAAASKEADLRPRWKIISPNDYLGEGSAGDALKQYLKFNKSALCARPYSAPILALRDWEVTDVAGYQKFVKVHPYSDAMKTPVELTNPALNESFVGIERYLETDRILKVVPKNDLMRPASGEIIYGIAKSKLDDHKKLLSEKVIAGESAGKHLIDLVRWLDEQVMLLLQSVPVERYSF
ncbi:AAA family ATPase [Amycolatopsis sp. NPDC051371]|uniref:AAA family ATPase n=1 Tax=Amycolatopsis sp. NPDC051371 TaxID=3155800 RepID=UPI00342B4D23